MPAPEQKAVVGDLQDELRATREDYRATVEELETANEELRAANEEVTSMNEELQATNEELQSSQEELQSVNEELQTLNDQLSQKLGELREANDDLSNLFRAADIPMIFVDAQLRLKRMAEPASRVINIQSSDIGRPLTDITHQIIDADPAEVARNVLANLVKVEREVDSKDGRSLPHARRPLPHRRQPHRRRRAELHGRERPEERRARAAGDERHPGAACRAGHRRVPPEGREAAPARPQAHQHRTARAPAPGPAPARHRAAEPGCRPHGPAGRRPPSARGRGVRSR